MERDLRTAEEAVMRAEYTRTVKKKVKKKGRPKKKKMRKKR